MPTLHQESSPTPLTTLGARTPLAHPALYSVVAALTAVIVVGAAWVFWPHSAVVPNQSAAPSAVPSAAAPVGVQYENPQYGLRVSLPDSWRGYGVAMFEWVAEDISSEAPDRTVAKGPQIHIIHPSVAGGNPYQDIPIMVFTTEQWAHVSKETEDMWSVSAAPMPPSVLASNSLYVFALPARYNYAFPPGWEDVDAIIQSGAVSAFKPCMVRPACLDATPRCLLPEPAEGWCK